MASTAAGAVTNSAASQVLRSSDLCRKLDEAAVRQLERVSRLKHYPAQTLILAQGHKTDAIYLPCSGNQLVERSVSSGRRQILAFLQRGDFLGFSTSDHYLYSARTLNASSVLRVPHTEFAALSEKFPQLRDNVGHISNQVLARVLDHLFAIGQKRAHERLAFLLWQLAMRQEQPMSDQELALPMRRADIGDYLGLTLETTSRAFSRLRREKIIATRGRDLVRIVDHAALSALAEVK